MTLVNVPVDTAILAAALTAAGYTVTAPVVVPPAPPPTVYPTTGLGVIYANGKFLWAHDWSNNAGPNIVANYAANVNGRTVAKFTAQAQYPYWLPAANPNPNNVPNNWVPSYDATKNTHLVIIARADLPGDTLLLAVDTYTVDANGNVTGDVPVGATLAISQYGGAPDANGFVTYQVPLTAFKTGTFPPVYKILLQDPQCPAGGSFEVEYAAFV